MPNEVWRFCVNQVKLYPLYEAQLKDEYKQAEIAYLHSGGDRSFDTTGVVDGSYTTSPVAVALEAKQEWLDQPYIKYLEKCVERMQMVVKGLEQKNKDVLDAIWQYGWSDNELLAHKVNMSRAGVARAKREIIERLAVRWGLWVA